MYKSTKELIIYTSNFNQNQHFIKTTIICNLYVLTQ